MGVRRHPLTSALARGQDQPHQGQDQRHHGLNQSYYGKNQPHRGKIDLIMVKMNLNMGKISLILPIWRQPAEKVGSMTSTDLV